MYDGNRSYLKDPAEIVHPDLISVAKDKEKKPFFITQKEHPVLSKKITFYLHECRMNELFDKE
jgi:hypothetical protein